MQTFASTSCVFPVGGCDDSGAGVRPAEPAGRRGAGPLCEACAAVALRGPAAAGSEIPGFRAALLAAERHDDSDDESDESDDESDESDESDYVDWSTPPLRQSDTRGLEGGAAPSAPSMVAYVHPEMASGGMQVVCLMKREGMTSGEQALLRSVRSENREEVRAAVRLLHCIGDSQSAGTSLSRSRLSAALRRCAPAGYAPFAPDVKADAVAPRVCRGARARA